MSIHAGAFILFACVHKVVEFKLCLNSNRFVLLGNRIEIERRTQPKTPATGPALHSAGPAPSPHGPAGSSAQPSTSLPLGPRRSPGPAQRPVPSARATPAHARAQAHPPASLRAAIPQPASPSLSRRPGPAYRILLLPRATAGSVTAVIPALRQHPGHARLGLSRPINGIPGLPCTSSPSQRRPTNPSRRAAHPRRAAPLLRRGCAAPLPRNPGQTA